MLRKIINLTSSDNDKIKQLKQLNSRKGRIEQNRMLIEGEHLIQEAIKAGAEFELLIYRTDNIDKYIDLWANLSSVTVYELKPALFNSLVGSVSPQGVAAVVKLPVHELDFSKVTSCLMLDEVQDPGNLGNILRTADAFGVKNIILGAGCADLYNSKVISASSGAIFRLGAVQLDLLESIQQLKEHDVQIIATSVDAEDSQTLPEYVFPERFAVILGNEGAGISQEVLDQADIFLHVPISSQADSLNVATTAAVILYETTRQQR